MKFKDISKSGTISWSPLRGESCIAIATVNQQFDANLSSDSTLEIYNLQIQNALSEPTIVASHNAKSNAFTSLYWHKDCLICSTQSNTLQIFNSDIKDFKLNYETEPETSKVLTLDVNGSTNQIASGGDYGNINIWSIDDSHKISKTISLRSATHNDEINMIKWNKTVPSILASASNSNVHVWDIRKSENTTPIMHVHDSNAASLWGNGPASLMISQSLEWSNSNATTLVVANSNDANPILQVWDLRYATCPIKNIKGGHTRGIVSISWNGFDEELLLSAGKDNNVCLWNPLLGQSEDSLMAILPNITNQWINDIKWCKWDPSLYSVSSFDGHTTIYSITQTNSIFQANVKIMESFSLDPSFDPQYQSHQTQQKPILSKAPSWYRVPCGASWGFGGKLVTYEKVANQTQSSQFQSNFQHLLTVHQISSDFEFLRRAEKLENALINDNLEDFCRYKIAEWNDVNDVKLAWNFVFSHLENDPKIQNDNILKFLGFASDDVNGDLSHQMGSLTASGEESAVQSPSEITDDFFLNAFEKNRENEVTNLFHQNFNMDSSGNTLGSLINKNILNGNISDAIESCIKENLWTEALLMCFFIEPKHIVSTLNRYLKHCVSNNQNEISSLLWSIIALQNASNNEQTISTYEQIVVNVDLKYWREVLAFVIRELNDGSNSKVKYLLIDKLTSRLIERYRGTSDKQWLSAALYCCILNGDYKNLIHFQQLINFLDLIEMLLVLHKISIPDVPLETNQLTSRYAELLAREGRLSLALKYISDESELKYRINGALNPAPKRQITQYPPQPHRVAPIVQKQHVPPFQHPSRPPSHAAHTPAPQFPPVQHSTGPFQPTQPGHIPTQQGHIPTVPFQPPQTNAMRHDPYQNYQSNFNLQPSQAYPPPVATLEPSSMMHVPPTNVHPIGMQQPPPLLPNTGFVAEPVTPGWNDPPVIKTLSAQKPTKFETPAPYSTVPTPISTPIPGYDPIAAQNVEPNVRQQYQSKARRTSSPPPIANLSPQNQQLYNVFEGLYLYLQQNSQSQAINVRRKMDDVRMKLETLKSKLSEHQLSDATLTGLSHIAAAISQNDYHTAMLHHTNLVSSTTFGETVAFLPAIKILLHLVQQLH